MTSPTMDCTEAEPCLGVLVLGALDPAERERVEDHLRDCPSCSAALAELALLPGLLHRVDLADFHPEAPPAELLERVLAQALSGDDIPASASVRPARRRLGLVMSGLAAASIVLLLVVFGRSGAVEAGGAVVATATDATTKVSATVALTPAPAGTALVLSLRGVAPGEHCELVAVGRDGRRETAATWVATYSGEAHVTGTTGLTVDRIDRLEVTTPEGATLVRLPVRA